MENRHQRGAPNELLDVQISAAALKINFACPNINFNIFSSSTENVVEDIKDVDHFRVSHMLSIPSVRYHSQLGPTGMQIGLKRPLCLSDHQMEPKLIGICWKIGSIPSRRRKKIYAFAALCGETCCHQQLGVAEIP